MPKPIIALTVGRNNLATPQREMQAVWTGCDVQYINAVLRSGGAPVLLPFGVDKEAVASVLAAADGVIFTGGGDVNSLVFGEEPHPRSTRQDPARDEMELEAARLAMEMSLPVLGICRGIQLLNIALGGTLIQDIPTQVPDANKHSSTGLAPVLLHNIDVEEGSLLARVLRGTDMAVNSYHHQALKDLGKGLRVSALARDGVIEAVESDDGRPLLAVQFHPEEIAADYPRFQYLFDWLVGEAGKQSAMRESRRCGVCGGVEGER